MPENKVPSVACRPCWIDRDGIVWSHHCDHKATPATAIPNDRLAEVRLALVDARILAIAYAVGYAIQHGIDPKGEKWHPTHKGIVDRATAALSLLGDTP